MATLINGHAITASSKTTLMLPVIGYTLMVPVSIGIGHHNIEYGYESHWLRIVT